MWLLIEKHPPDTAKTAWWSSGAENNRRCARIGGGREASAARVWRGELVNASLRVAATWVVCGVGAAWSPNILKRQLIPCGRGQLEPDCAPVVKCGNPARVEEPGWHGSCTRVSMADAAGSAGIRSARAESQSATPNASRDHDA
jgi:hypothetical protein